MQNLRLTGESGVCSLATHQVSLRKPQITCAGEAGFLFQASQNLTISSLSFNHCGQSIPSTVYTRDFGGAKASLAFDSIENLVLNSLGVYNSSGYGFLTHNIYGRSSIQSCELLYNRGSVSYRGGNALLNYTECYTNNSYSWSGAEIGILDSIFSFGGYDDVFNDTHNTGTFATGIALTLW